MTANTNPLSYNQYIQTMAGLAVYQADQNNGVWEFSDAPPELQVPQMLNYAELRIQRDLDLLISGATQGFNTNPQYYIPAGSGNQSIPYDDFLVIENVQLVIFSSTNQVIETIPLIQASVEFLQNCYGGISSAGTPKYFCVLANEIQNPGTWIIRVGPFANVNWPIAVRGKVRMPSLYQYSVAGVADTQYTYISTYYPDLLIMASMVYITMFQRNFGGTSDDQQMGMNYEKQYQILKVSAVMEEDRKKGMGSAWSGYSTPVSATPTR